MYFRTCSFHTGLRLTNLKTFGTASESFIQDRKPSCSRTGRQRTDLSDFLSTIGTYAVIPRGPLENPIEPLTTSIRANSSRSFTFWLGLAAYFVAIIGVYAVASYLASLRNLEFSVRAALGATRSNLTLKSLMAPAPAILIGLPFGVLLGLNLTPGFTRFIFHVEPDSTGVAWVTIVAVMLTALLSSLAPALRASKPDLTAELRGE